MLTFVSLVLLAPVVIWIFRWASRVDKAAKPPYSFARRNAPFLFIAFFMLLFCSMVASWQFAAYYIRSGLTAYRHGDYPTAEAYFGRAENIDGNNAAAPYYLGICRLHDGQNKSALQEFKAVCATVEHERHTSPSDRQLEAQSQFQIQQINSKP